MIPKKIHYCWFGRGPKPKLAEKCIKSWQKYMPDYEIIEWNEDNFDINLNAYTKMCYQEKKYAFLSDYVRLLVVEEQGGIYFDTDVEVVKSFDDFLGLPSFLGFESDEYINTGLGFGATPHNELLVQMIREYGYYLDGKHGVTGCPGLNTKAAEKFGLLKNGLFQTLYLDETKSKQVTVIYPKDYFNPRNNNTGKLSKTENTCSIHWYSMSWGSKKTKVRSAVTRVFHRLFGENCFDLLKREK